jgi:hypothetical protein
MPTNLLKIYNQLLEIDYLSEPDRIISLKRIFKRDIEENDNFNFRSKKINPTKREGVATDILFSHLTTIADGKNDKKRSFESARSRRLHWIKHLIEERKTDNMLIFSVLDPNGIRTYIYDKDEKYVIILEPYRNGLEYYLITAYHLDGNNPDKLNRKFKRKLPEIH